MNAAIEEIEREIATYERWLSELELILTDEEEDRAVYRQQSHEYRGTIVMLKALAKRIKARGPGAA